MTEPARKLQTALAFLGELILDTPLSRCVIKFIQKYNPACFVIEPLNRFMLDAGFSDETILKNIILNA